MGSNMENGVVGKASKFAAAALCLFVLLNGCGGSSSRDGISEEEYREYLEEGQSPEEAEKRIMECHGGRIPAILAVSKDLKEIRRMLVEHYHFEELR